MQQAVFRITTDSEFRDHTCRCLGDPVRNQELNLGYSEQEKSLPFCISSPIITTLLLIEWVLAYSKNIYILILGNDMPGPPSSLTSSLALCISTHCPCHRNFSRLGVFLLCLFSANCSFPAGPSRPRVSFRITTYEGLLGPALRRLCKLHSDKNFFCIHISLKIWAQYLLHRNASMNVWWMNKWRMKYLVLLTSAMADTQISWLCTLISMLQKWLTLQLGILKPQK